MVSQKSVANIKILEEAVDDSLCKHGLIIPLSALVKWLEERGIKFGKMVGEGYNHDQLGQAITNLIRAGKVEVMWLPSVTGYENEFLVGRVMD